MAIRIAWNEQEALLLLDAYEKIQKAPEKKVALTTALSINLRRRAVDQGVTIDDTFRNYTGIAMRLSEIEKIIHPDNTGLTKTSELFRRSAELYLKHRRTFLKNLQEVEEYRVKILADMVGFDLLESVVLLDAYLGIGAPGETRAHTARLAFVIELHPLKASSCITDMPPRNVICLVDHPLIALGNRKF